MEIKFYCQECNEIIDGTAAIDRYGEIEFTVKLCDTCKTKAYDEGVESVEE